MRLPASQRIPTAVDRRVSNFDQFFVRLPIKLIKRPHRTSVVPPSSRRCGLFAPVFSLPARAPNALRRPAARSGWASYLYEVTMEKTMIRFISVLACPSTAVSGGNVAMPLVIGLLSVCGYERRVKGHSAWLIQLPGHFEPDGSPGKVVDGLWRLTQTVSTNGYRRCDNSWIGPGQNKSVAPNHISDALGQVTLDALCRRMGLPKGRSWSFYPSSSDTVDQLTPENVCRTPARDFAFDGYRCTASEQTYGSDASSVNLRP